MWVSKCKRACLFVTNLSERNFNMILIVLLVKMEIAGKKIISTRFFKWKESLSSCVSVPHRAQKTFIRLTSYLVYVADDPQMCPRMFGAFGPDWM